MDILLVENQPPLASRIRRVLSRAGHEVELAGDGPSALESLAAKRYDLMLLAASLPGFDGFEVLGKVRSAGLRLRVLMLATWPEISERVSVLKAGVDDFLTWPFEMQELVVRVDSIAKLSVDPAEFAGAALKVGCVCMDVVKHRVTRDEKVVELSPREFEVLHLLMSKPGRPLSRNEISQRIWFREHDYDTRTVEIVIMRLRKKLDHPGTESVIRTVRSVGYAMEPSSRGDS